MNTLSVLYSSFFSSKFFSALYLKKNLLKLIFFFFLYFPFGKWILSITKIKSMHEIFLLSISFSSFKIFFYHFGYLLITLNIFLQMWTSCERKWYNHGLEVCKKKENLALEFMEVDHSKLTAVGFSHYILSLGLDNLTI